MDECPAVWGLGQVVGRRKDIGIRPVGGSRLGLSRRVGKGAFIKVPRVVVDNFLLHAIAAAFSSGQRLHAVVGLLRGLLDHPRRDRRTWPFNGARMNLLAVNWSQGDLCSRNRLWLLYVRIPNGKLAVRMLILHWLRVILWAWSEEYMVLRLPVSGGQVFHGLLLGARNTIALILS